MIQPAKAEDAYELELRPEDAREVTEGWRVQVAAAIQAHRSYALRDREGRLVALGGVCSWPDGLVPWLLCSPHLHQHRHTVWRASVHMVNKLRKAGVPVLNNIPKDSTSNRRFVEALGFRIEASQGDGPDTFYLPNV